MNDLNILIKAKLDEVASTANIDEQIKKISQKLSTINLEIKINDTVLKTLQDFSQSMKNIQSVIDEQNKIIQTNIEITKEQDGTIKTVQTDLLKSGEIIQKTTTEINKQNEALNQNREAFNQEAKSIQANIDLVDNLIKIQEKYNNEKLKSTTNTYKDGIVTNIKTTPADNSYTNRTTIIDIQKQLDLIDKLQSSIDKTHNKMRTLYEGVDNPEVQGYLNKLDESYQKLSNDLSVFADKKKMLTTEDIQNLNKSVESFNSYANNYKSKIDEIINAEQKREQYEKSYDEWWQKQLKSRELQQEETINKLEQSLNKSIPVGNINLSNSDNYQKIISAYNEINQQIEIYKDKENILTKEVVKDIESRISALKSEYNQLLANEKEQEQEQIRLANLGTKQNIAYTGYSNEDLKQYVSNLYGATAQITKFYGEQKTANGIVNSAKVAIQQLNGTYKEFTVTVDSASQSVYQSAEVIKNAAGKDMDLVGQLKVAFERFPVWIVASTAVMDLIHQVQTGIQTLNDLNKAQTNIQMITGGTAEQTAQWTKSLSNLSAQLHDTTTNVMSASEEFLRAGHNIQETQQLIEASTVMSKISGQAQADVAQELIAIQNAFNMSAQDMMSVVDKLTTVDNDSATSTAELGQALERTAASAQNAGITFDELVSYVATVSSVTRKSAESIGESFKTIFARMQSIKQGLDYDQEGQPLSNVEASLNKVGIALRDSQYQFKNMDEVLNEVAQKWSSLNDVQKASVAQEIAGTRQRENFLVLMDHYNEALKLQQKMTDSSGSALKRYQDYAQSTEAHLNDLTNALQRMWMQILKSSDVNSAISAMTSLVNTISSVVTRLGTIPTVIGIGLPILLSFNKALYGTFSKEVITAVDTFIKDLRAIPAATAIAEAGVNLLTNSFKSLGIIVAGLAKELLPFLLLTGVSYAIGYIIDKINEARQAQAELDKQNNEIVSNYQKNSSTVDVLVKEYEDLSKKSGLSADEQQRLVDVQNQLNKLMPNLTDRVDEQGNAHLKNADTVEKEIEYTKQLLQLQNQQKVVSFDKNIESQFDNIAKLQRQISLLQNSINGYNKLPDSVKNQPMYLEAYIKDERNLLIAQQQLKDAFDKVASSIKDNANTYIQLHDTKNVLTETDKKYIETQIEENTANIKNAEQGKEYYNTLKTQIDGMINARDELSKLTGSQQNDNAVKTQAIAILEKYGFTASQAASLIEEMTNKTNVLINTAHNEESGITLLNDAVNKLSNGYSLSQDEIDKLVAKYPDLANALTEENGLTNINIQALEEKRKAEIDSANATIKSLEAEVEKQKEALAAKLPMYASEIEAIKNVATARQIAAGIQQKESKDLQKRLEASQPMWEKYANKSLNKAIADVLSSTNNTNSYASQLIQLGRLEETIKSLNSAISKVSISSSSPVSPSSSGYFPSGSSSGSKSGSSGNSYVDKVFQATSTIKQQIDDIKAEGDSLDQTLTTLQNKINIADSENDIVTKTQLEEEYNSKLKERETLYEQQISSLKNLYEQYKNFFEQQFGKYFNYKPFEQITETDVQNAINNLQKAATDFENKAGHATSEALKNQYTAQADALKNISDSLDTYYSQVKDINTAIQEQTNSWYDVQKQIAQTSNELESIVKSEIQSYIEAQQALAKAKLDQAQKQLQIDEANLEKQIFNGMTEADYETMVNNRVKALQAQIDAIDAVNSAEQEEIDRQNKLLEIQKLQTQLQNAQNEKTIQQLQYINGSWQFVYVADQTKIDDLTSQLQQKQQEYNRWEQNIADNHRKQQLQDEINAENDLLQTKKDSYSKQKQALEDAFQAEKDAFDKQYQDIDTLTTAMFDSLITQYNDNFALIVQIVAESVAKINAELAKVNQPDVSDLLDGLSSSSSGSSSGGSSSSSNSSRSSSSSNSSSSSAYENEIKYLESIRKSSTASSGTKSWANQAEYLLNTAKSSSDSGTKAWAKDQLSKMGFSSQQISQLTGYDTGGVVPETGIILAHGKERVLTQEQTKAFDKIAYDILPQLTRYSLNLQNFNPTIQQATSPVINIDKLEFPNVKDGQEVIDTLKKLPRIALQYGGS